MADTPHRRPTTLKMVAERADCSIAVVSTVLNNSRGNSMVSEKNRKRIVSIARELGYRPNYLSRSLKTSRSQALGVYVQPRPWAGLGKQYEMTILGGVEIGAFERGYNIVVLNMRSGMQPRICLERLAESRIDGILLMHADQRGEWIDELTEASSRVVAVDCCEEDKRLGRVIFDNEGAVRIAVEHLAELGHRRIGFISPCTSGGLLETPGRKSCFLETVRRLGLDTDPDLVFGPHNTPEPIDIREQYCQKEGRLGMRTLLGMARPATAVVSYNSLSGLCAMREAQAMGLNVPGDVSIVGIDNHQELAQYFEPLLTRIDHPLSDMGQAGANLLVDLIEDERRLPVREVFPARLLPGGSSAPPRS